MTYVYECKTCGKSHDVIKSVVDFERTETCPTCESRMARVFAMPKIYLSNTAVQEKKWQPALGRAATDSELKSVARARGWEEVGNERTEKHIKPPEVEYPSFSNDDIQSLCRKMELEGTNRAEK